MHAGPDRPQAALTGREIAIIGMACHFPGAKDPDAFWRNLRDGVESVRSFTREELVAAGVSAETVDRPNYVRAGVVLEDMESFDAAFFGIDDREAALMDPQHRHFLECSWEALERAGYDPARFPGSISVFGGCGMNGYQLFHLLPNANLMKSPGTAAQVRFGDNDKDDLTSRVASRLGLRGPAITVQTACSTSLVAMHLASQSLLAGECDLALAGGVTIEVPHRQGYVFQEGEILSEDGHCRSFDDQSTGTIFGSGAGVVVLRRLEDALAGRDTIHAVIRSTAVNNDGSRKVSYLAPSVAGQSDAISEAIAMADINAGSVGYVEAHGTGTRVGDPIEVTALTQAFSQTTDKRQYCGIGSVKTNIGHLDTAAGVASVIKAVEALKHRALPPSLNFRQPNRLIDFENSPFFVNASLREWLGGGEPRRALISSLGVGGTNAHMILEEAPPPPPPGGAPGGEDPSRSGLYLFPLSARSPEALQTLALRLAEYLASGVPVRLMDVAHTLQSGRRAFPQHRRCYVAGSREELCRLLVAAQPPAAEQKEAAASPERAQLEDLGRKWCSGAEIDWAALNTDQHQPRFRVPLPTYPFDRRRHWIDADATQAD